MTKPEGEQIIPIDVPANSAKAQTTDEVVAQDELAAELLKSDPEYTKNIRDTMIIFDEASDMTPEMWEEHGN